MGGGEFRTPKVMNQTSPESHRRMHQMSAYQRKVMSNAVGAWQSVGTTLSDTPLDEHAVRAAWERREWARQAEEAAAAAARREEDERAARLERDQKSFELAALFVRLFRSLDAIAGGDERTARAWMKAENLALGHPPIERIQTVTGLVDVVDYLDARRAPL